MCVSDPTAIQTLTGPTWPCGACNQSCSKPIQTLTGPIWLLPHPVRKFLSSLSWPIWPCGACNQSCSKPIQTLTGPTWPCGACNQSCLKPIQALTGPTWLSQPGKKRPKICEAHNPLFCRGFSFPTTPLTMLIFFSHSGLFSALFFFFFCQNFINNFPYLIPLTNSGSKASLGPSGPWGLASNPDQQLSKASLGQVGLSIIP